MSNIFFWAGPGRGRSKSKKTFDFTNITIFSEYSFKEEQKTSIHYSGLLALGGKAWKSVTVFPLPIYLQIKYLFIYTFHRFTMTCQVSVTFHIPQMDATSIFQGSLWGQFCSVGFFQFCCGWFLVLF